MQIANKQVIGQAFILLPPGTKPRLWILSGFLIFISFLDLIALYLVGSLASTGISYTRNEPALFSSKLLDLLHLDGSSFTIQFTSISLLVIIIFIIKTLLAILGNRKILSFLSNSAAIASSNMVAKLLGSKPSYILGKRTQELLYSVTGGIDNLILGYVASFCILLTESLFLILVIIGVIYFAPSAGLIALIVFGFSAVVINRMTSIRSRSLAEKTTRLSVKYNERVLETLSVYRELLLRDKLNTSSGETQTLRALTLKLQADLMLLPILSKYLFEFSLIIGAALVALTQILFEDSEGAISSVVIFTAASIRILPSLIRAQNSFLAMKQSEGNAQVTLDVVAEIDKSIKEFKNGNQLETTATFIPSVVVENLTFSYEDSNQVVLRNINFSIEAGQFVAIVGQSGVGKSTLVDLLLGMLEPSDGKIRISGFTPMEAIKIWPGAISYVPQDISIIDGTISKNVALSDIDQRENKICIALERSHFLNDVMAMNNKLEEVVGERGTRLSGGQKQRLGIARALYTDPQLIVFDEATSSLDPITEKSVTNAIYSKKNGVTLIVIAHRLSTVKHADQVIFLDQGELVAKGTFNEVRSLVPKFNEQAKLVNL